MTDSNQPSFPFAGLLKKYSSSSSSTSSSSSISSSSSGIVSISSKPTSLYDILGDTLLKMGISIIASLIIYHLISGKWYLPRWLRFKRGGASGHHGLVSLNGHESTLAKSLVSPSSIDITFDDIGGLNDVKRELHESLVFPFLHPEYFPVTSIRQPPKGILLYGPPGTGKTLIAKAIAKECNANFLNIPIEQLSQYFFGESEKMVTAVFTLARKLSPCIIFLDELESIFNKHIRTSPHSHEVHKKQLSLFLSMWDGFTNRDEVEGCRVIVVATTNLPSLLDDAVMRRLPLRLHVGLPQDAERLSILRIVLRNEILDDEFDWDVVVRKTQGYSGSDIRELCKKAAMYPMREHMETHTRLQKHIQQLKSSSDEFRNLSEKSAIYKAKLIEATNLWLLALPNSSKVVQKRPKNKNSEIGRQQHYWWWWLWWKKGAAESAEKQSSPTPMQANHHINQQQQQQQQQQQEKVMEELELKMRPIHHNDFVQARAVIKPSVTPTGVTAASTIASDLD